MVEKAEKRPDHSRIYSIAKLTEDNILPAGLPAKGVAYENVIVFPGSEIRLGKSPIIEIGDTKVSLIDAQLVIGHSSAAMVRPDYFDMPEGKSEVITIFASGIKRREIEVENLRGPLKTAFKLATEERRRRIKGH